MNSSMEFKFCFSPGVHVYVSFPKKTAEFHTERMKIKKSGFREYDARWLYPKDIDLDGIQDLGKGLGSQIIKKTKKTNPKVVVGHDYRSYSEEV